MTEQGKWRPFFKVSRGMKFVKYKIGDKNTCKYCGKKIGFIGKFCEVL